MYRIDEFNRPAGMFPVFETDTGHTLGFFNTLEDAKMVAARMNEPAMCSICGTAITAALTQEPIKPTIT